MVVQSEEAEPLSNKEPLQWEIARTKHIGSQQLYRPAFEGVRNTNSRAHLQQRKVWTKWTNL